MDTGYISRQATPTGYSGNRIVFIVLAAALVVSAMVFSALPASAATNPFFAGTQVDSSDISPFTKWTALMPRYERQRAEANSKCIGEGCLNQKWEKLLTMLEGKPVQVQIDAVNKFFNAMRYVSDQANYGTADRWNTPYELMERGGDCEDYAIAKYISLKRLGVSESDMRILIVKDANLGGTLHAILESSAGEVAEILDNQTKSVLPAAKIFHYQPIYAINESKWWAYK
jgi:predicted transglutaminase-like cysteine proteinase